MIDTTPLLSGEADAGRPSEDESKEDDDVPDAAPVLLHDVGDRFSWREFLQFVGALPVGLLSCPLRYSPAPFRAS